VFWSGNDWKIKHYVLSMTVPNENVTEVVKIKTPIEDALMQKMTKIRLFYFLFFDVKINFFTPTSFGLILFLNFATQD
jgi:hypothetical protein